eukprot:583261-Prorocentrum_lima.AAC.1
MSTDKKEWASDAASFADSYGVLSSEEIRRPMRRGIYALSYLHAVLKERRRFGTLGYVDFS